MVPISRSTYPLGESTIYVDRVPVVYRFRSEYDAGTQTIRVVGSVHPVDITLALSWTTVQGPATDASIDEAVGVELKKLQRWSRTEATARAMSLGNWFVAAAGSMFVFGLIPVALFYRRVAALFAADPLAAWALMFIGYAGLVVVAMLAAALWANLSATSARVIRPRRSGS